MAQFDVYRNPNPDTQSYAPFLIDVQSDLLDPLSTTVVIPLIKAKQITKPISRLNPEFKIKNMKTVLSTAELAGVSHQELGDYVMSLAEHRTVIIDALDLLFTGI